MDIQGAGLIGMAWLCFSLSCILRSWALNAYLFQHSRAWKIVVLCFGTGQPWLDEVGGSFARRVNGGVRALERALHEGASRALSPHSCPHGPYLCSCRWSRVPRSAARCCCRRRHWEGPFTVAAGLHSSQASWFLHSPAGAIVRHALQGSSFAAKHLVGQPPAPN